MEADRLSTRIVFRPRIEWWRASVCAAVAAYLSLCLATNSLRIYHWGVLVAVPFAAFAGDRARKFFLDWSPFFLFWMVYDRLRLIQPLLYGRVAVNAPYELERFAFGWIFGGSIPAHASHCWLSSHPALLSRSIEISSQAIYFSHLLLVPFFILWLWRRGERVENDRDLFLQHRIAFALLNFTAIAIYLILPVAPPWWITLRGFTQPSLAAVTNMNLAEAMNGALIQGMIRNAGQWFAAVPSLHGAYPVLLLLLCPRRWRLAGRVAICIYALAMWTSTVVLNQHYIIDLLAGAAMSIGAFSAARLFNKRSSAKWLNNGVLGFDRARRKSIE